MRTFKVGDRVTVKPGGTLPVVDPDLIFVVTNIDPAIFSAKRNKGPLYTIVSNRNGSIMRGFAFTEDMLIPAGKQYKCNLSKLFDKKA
jgi:hypothetical protein